VTGPSAAASALAGGQGLRATEADRAALAEVLARPELRDRLADGLALRRLLAGWWDRFLALLENPEAERYASLGRAVFLVAAAAALALLWRAANRRAGRRRAAARAARGAATAAGGELPEGLDGAARAGAEASVAAAERELAAGRLEGAVRTAYAAAAGGLARRLDLRVAPALTGPELAARGGGAPFDELWRLHDRTVFGRRAPAVEEARRAVDLASALARDAVRSEEAR